MNILSCNFMWICVILCCVYLPNYSELGNVDPHFTDEETVAGDLPEIIQLEGDWSGNSTQIFVTLYLVVLSSAMRIRNT